MISLEEAQTRILEALPALGAQKLKIATAAGRFLSEDILAPAELPPFDNSAMDGYAVRAEDLVRATEKNPIVLELRGKIPAGKAFTEELIPGSCLRIFTGSPLPRGADAVVMQEDISALEDRITFREPARPWENIRLRGEDVRAGNLIAKKGQRLSPGLVSLAAAAGCARVPVTRQPRVGILATGSELREPGVRLDPGQIFESNRLLLQTLVSRTGAIPKVYPILTDLGKEIQAGLQRALDECDVVISTGGVSVGEFDLVQTAFQEIGGTVDFWKLAIRPGKPFLFGRRNSKLLFGLPGNPVSTAVSFYVLVRPALIKIQGGNDPFLPGVHGTLAQPLVNRGGRRHFMRVRLSADGHVFSAGPQASHMLHSLATANALLDVPPNARLEPETKVKVLLFDFPFEE